MERCNQEKDFQKKDFEDATFTKLCNILGELCLLIYEKNNNIHCLKNVQMRTRKNSVYGHFSRSIIVTISFLKGLALDLFGYFYYDLFNFIL